MQASILTGIFFFASLGRGAAAENKSVDYARDIAPIFQTSCVKCHGAGVAMGKLRLDSEAEILKGGVSGPAIVPGKSGDSLLVKRILGLTNGPRMPMGGDPLPDDKVQLIRAWIDQNQFSAVPAAVSPAAEAPKTEAQNSQVQSAVFAQEVRPILAERCYACHGAQVQQHGLRLDSLAAILKGGDFGPDIVPGHSEKSQLVRRLEAAERPQMPYGGPPLSGAQIATIKHWIDAGAPGPDSSTPIATGKQLKHWAYMEPVRPELPKVQDAKWCRNPIDYFILAKLEKEGLKPSPEADKATLLRRVYLDVIGIPPTPQEVDAFLADKSPDAYDKVVDHLFASPHYGERWARPWLDLARYADSNGYEKDLPRTAWEYRDWVIRSLNSDMSFREFTIDQVAGDMLPHPTHDQLIATGFNRNTELNQEGGVDPYEYYWDDLVDRVNTTSLVWLGSTLGCAECHNHKFDPFTQKDYYRFLAFFDNSQYHVDSLDGKDDNRYVQEAVLELPSPAQETKSKQFRSQIAALQQELDTQTPQLEAAQKSWESEMLSADKQWQTLHPDQYTSQGGATLKLEGDESVLAGGTNPQADTYTVETKTSLSSITGLRIEVLPDASLPHGGPGRDPDGNFFLSGVDLEIAPLSNPRAVQHVTWKDAQADEVQEGYGVDGWFLKDGQIHGWAVDTSGSASHRRQAVLIPDKPFGFSGGTLLTIRMKHQMRHSSRNIGRFRLSVTASNDPRFIVRLPANLWPVLEMPAQQRSGDQADKLAVAYRSISPLLDPERKQIEDLKKSLDQLAVPTAMVMSEKPGFTRPATFIRERGSFSSKGDLVYAGVPSILNPLPHDAMPNRLGLAEWLVSDDNPLTARVTVNHFWETIFGHGIVETSEDFGSQGSLPSHPELLDWLATEFMRDGWDMKKIQRLMVTSATYRQSSSVSPALKARDPYNELYARGPRFRVEAEMVHDIALADAGLLSSKMYGPSVYPYQPAGIWDVPYSDSAKWVLSPGEDRYRRAIYTFIRRSAPYPSLTVFDATSREFCTVRRVRTNTPLQALTTLNDPFFFDAARAMAKRMLTEGGKTPADLATYGFRLCVSRKPTPSELNSVLAFYRLELQNYRKDTQAADQTISAKPGEVKNAPELASWTMVANVLLNMDETISKE